MKRHRMGNSRASVGSVIGLLLAAALPAPALSREPPSPGSDAAAIAPLAGEWVLTRMNGQAVPAGGDPPTIMFDEAGGVNGTTGVNRYRGTPDLAQLAEGRLTLGQIATTRRAGPPEAMKRETQFLAALRKAQVWKLSGRTLYLEDGRRELLNFRRRR